MEPTETNQNTARQASSLPEVDATLRMLADLEQRVSAMRSSAAHIDERERTLISREAEASAALADAQSRLAQAEARCAEAEARVREVEQSDERLAAARADLDARESAIRDAEARATELTEREQALVERESALREAEARATELAERERALEDRQRAIDELHQKNENLQRAIDERQRAAEDLARAVEERERAIEDRQRALEERENAATEQSGHDTEADAQVIAQLNTARGRIAELESRNSQLRSDAEENQREMERAARMLTEAHRQAAEAKKAAPARPSAPAGPVGGPRTEAFHRSRRARLVSIRRRLRADAKKLEQISRVLSERQSKVSASEKMVSLQKSTLLEAEAAREASEIARGEAAAMLNAARRVQERYERRGAAATAATFLASSLIALGLIVGGAWMGVDRTAKPECRATSTVSMSPGADQLGEEAAEVWMQFVTDLPEDPRFVEYAAGRFKARGVRELASPADVTRMLDRSFDLEPIGPGRITASLKGTGTGHTTQTLATLATSITTYANETRNMRADGATTASDTAPASQAEIIDDPRIKMFGMVAGAGACLLLIALLMVWRALRGAVIRAVRDTADVLPMGAAAEAALVPATADGPAQPVAPIRKNSREAIQRRGSFKS